MDASPTKASTASVAPSRRQSLISKQTAPVVKDLRPSDLLIQRFKGWKQVTKQLCTYMEGVADIEYNTAKEYTRLGGVIQVPFREGHQFLGDGGIQDVYSTIRTKTRQIADLHAGLAKTVDGFIVQHLHKLVTEIKAHVKNIQMDTGKLADTVAIQRDLSTMLIAELAKSITALKNTPLAVDAKHDPHLLNAAVMDQLVRQVHAENQLQKSIIIMQQASAHFEEGVVRSLQSSWATFHTWQSQTVQQIQEIWTAPAHEFQSLFPTKEWVAFAARSDCLLDPDTPLRNPEAIEYPGKDDPSVMAVHQGFLERKRRYTKSYQENFYVLTPAGFLHEMGTSSDPKTLARSIPAFSLFLPECTLGPASTLMSKSHKWHITLTSPGTQSKVVPLGLSITHRPTRLFSFDKKNELSFSFRAKSHEEMMEWWNDIKQLSKVYLTSSEPMDRSGIVPAAVRAAGYIEADYLEEEGEEEEEGEGSSMEEEDEESQVETRTAEGERSLVPIMAPVARRVSQGGTPQRRVSIQVAPREMILTGPATGTGAVIASSPVGATAATAAAGGGGGGVVVPGTTAAAGDATSGDAIPSYSSTAPPAASSGIILGPGGYAVEKKSSSSSPVVQVQTNPQLEGTAKEDDEDDAEAEDDQAEKGQVKPTLKPGETGEKGDGE